MDKSIPAAIGLLITGALASSTAFADLDDVRINAFGTLGIASMHGEADGTRYGLNSEYKDGETFESVSRGAVQAGYDITEDFSITLQLLADRRREANGIGVDVDWAYFAYQATSQITLRAGVLRVPLFMFSETLDVGYSYVWIRPPQAFYQGVPFSNYTATDILWNIELPQGELQIQPFYGRVEEQHVNFSGFEDVDIDGDDAHGLNVFYNFDYGSFRVGYFTAESSVTIDNAGPQNGNFSDSKVAFMSAGYNIEFDNWLTAAEISTVDAVAADSTSPMFPLNSPLEQDSWYMMVGYRFGSWTPHITYGESSTSATTNFGPQPNAGEQESLLLGVRYDWKPGISIKFEYETIETTSDFNGRFSGPAVGPVLPTRMPNPNFGNRDAEIFTIAIDYVL